MFLHHLEARLQSYLSYVYQKLVEYELEQKLAIYIEAQLQLASASAYSLQPVLSEYHQTVSCHRLYLNACKVQL